MSKSGTPDPGKLYYRIGDVASLLGVKPYVLRYWETEFPMISPRKSASGQRVYRRSDVDTARVIKHLLYEEKYSIVGARRRINQLRKQGGLKAFQADGPAAAQAPHEEESRAERLGRLRELAAELKELGDAPIEGLFRF